MGCDIVQNKSNQNCCPACREAIGENFKGSGSETESFICLKCGESHISTNYFKCKICNGIFCVKCLYFKVTREYSCPSCQEKIGEKFKGSGSEKESFDCLKCGKKYYSKNYFKCDKCDGIFCYKCPQPQEEDNILTQCPACGELAGNKFNGNYNNLYVDCLKCGKYLTGVCFKCKTCNGVFCYNCPNKKYENFASCPNCNEPAGNYFKGNEKNFSFNCLKCGDLYESFFYCYKCQSIICYRCAYNPQKKYDKFNFK